MDINIFAQTLFYLVASIAIIVVGALLAVILYHLIRTVKNVEIFTNKLNDASDEIKAKIHQILERLAALPVISTIAEKFMGKKATTHHKKGRTKE